MNLISSSFSKASSISSRLLTAVLLFVISHGSLVPQLEAALIPERDIEEILSEIEAIEPNQSSTRLRRAYKNLIRDTQSLLRKFPDSPNRFSLLHSNLKLQIKLLSLDDSDRTREELYETCEALLLAPEPYAEQRLDAEIFLADRQLVTQEKSPEERAALLKKLVDGYYGTSAELKSFRAAVKMTEQWEIFDMKTHYTQRIEDRFADNPLAISFLRQQMGFLGMHAIFSGTFQTGEEEITFPFDRLGNSYVVIFWSTQDPNHESFLSGLKEAQSLEPSRYETFSFNLDELDDEGRSVLNKVGLVCTPLRLPDQRRSPTFLTYARRSPHLMYVSEYGRVIFDGKNIKNEELPNAPGNKKKHLEFRYPRTVPLQQRYYTQLKSLFAGEFLLHAMLNKDPDHPELKNLIREIRSLLPETLLRYRLSFRDSTRAYQKINQLCTDTAQSFTSQPELRLIQQLRVIALMGLWNFERDPSSLSTALSLAQDILKNEDPSDPSMVARYCLVQHELREGNEQPKEILKKLIPDLSREEPSPLSLAMASVLTIYGSDLDLHEHYRKRFLDSNRLDPASVRLFLRDRRHRLYLFRGDIGTTSLDRYDRYRERLYVINNGLAPEVFPFPESHFQNLDGSEFSLPVKSRDKLSMVLFLEPPSQGNIILNPNIYKVPTLAEIEEAKRKEAERLAEMAKKKKKKSRPIRMPKPAGVLNTLFELGDLHVNDEIRVILVFLGGDLQQIKKIRDRYRIKAKILHAPEGLRHPIVNSLGLFATDHFPNTFLLNRHGNFRCYVTGMPYRVEPNKLMRATELSIRNHLFRYDLEAGYTALKAGDFKRAMQLFSGPYVSEGHIDQLDNWRQSGGKTEFHKWTPSQNQGLAISLIGLKKWDEALKAIEKAKDEHMVYFRQDQDKPSVAGISLHRTHAIILEELGRKTEAKALRNKASLPPTRYHVTSSKKFGFDEVYDDFGEKLQKLDLKVP